MPYLNSEVAPFLNEVRSRLTDTILAANMTPTEVSADYTAKRSDVVLLVDATDAAVTITLPSVNAALGDVKWIMKVDASVNAVTVAAGSSDSIQGSASISLAAQWSKCLLSTDLDATWLRWI